MSEAKKCPKCANVMKRGDRLSTYGGIEARLVKVGDIVGDKVIPFHCENCGYIEFYNEKKIKESAKA